MMGSSEKVLLIGVDGGATHVRAHQVHVSQQTRGDAYALGTASASLPYPVTSFQAIPSQCQLEEIRCGKIKLGTDEKERGEIIVATIAQAIAEVVRESESCETDVVVGIGMPGLKTKNGRGIAVMNHGPRIPELATQVEISLATAGVALSRPIHRVGSDAEYCGIGEQFAVDGLFRDVHNAYYLGGGTGLAEAIKLSGELVTMDQVSGWMAKAWEMRSVRGRTFEQLISARGINQTYMERSSRYENADGTATHDCLQHLEPPFPEHRALRGDPVATEVLDTAADAVAELILERITCVHRGRSTSTHFGPRYAQLTIEHENRGVLLDRIILGQRIGYMYADPTLESAFRQRVNASLTSRIVADGDNLLVRKYLCDDHLKPSVIMASRLPSAAALGAAIDAARQNG